MLAQTDNLPQRGRGTTVVVDEENDMIRFFMFRGFVPSVTLCGNPPSSFLLLTVVHTVPPLTRGAIVGANTPLNNNLAKTNLCVRVGRAGRLRPCERSGW